MSDGLRFTRLRIENILGIEEFDVELGALTMLGGRNGRGKTSVIDAVLALLGGGDTSDLLHVGAEAGEIYAELSDGTWFRRRITADGRNTLTAGHPERGTVSKPAGYLRALLDAVALNPVEIITADEARRTALVLEALPLAVDESEVLAAVAGVKLDDETRGRLRDAIQPGRHALQVIDAVHRILYDERTGLNRLAKEKAAAAKELRDAVPPAALRSEPPNDIDRIDDELTKLAEHERTTKNAIRDERDDEVRAADAELEAAIAVARKRRDERTAAAQEKARTAYEHLTAADVGHHPDAHAAGPEPAGPCPMCLAFYGDDGICDEGKPPISPHRGQMRVDIGIMSGGASLAIAGKHVGYFGGSFDAARPGWVCRSSAPLSRTTTA